MGTGKGVTGRARHPRSLRLFLVGVNLEKEIRRLSEMS